MRMVLGRAGDCGRASTASGVGGYRRADYTQSVPRAGLNPPPDFLGQRDEVADVVWSMNSAEYYTLLVRECGWPPERFARWLADTWSRLFLTTATDAARPAEGGTCPGGNSVAAGAAAAYRGPRRYPSRGD
jgi:hypothetical protein